MTFATKEYSCCAGTFAPALRKAFGNTGSVAVLAEILLSSPWKLFIFIIKKYVYRIKVSNKTDNWILKKASLLTARRPKLQAWITTANIHSLPVGCAPEFDVM